METLWEKVTESDKSDFATKKFTPIVKSQFRVKKVSAANATAKKASVQIHLYASIILFICASAPRAKITLTNEVEFNIEDERNQLVIYKNDKSIHLCLNDSENLLKWAESLSNLGIPERDEYTKNVRANCERIDADAPVRIAEPNAAGADSRHNRLFLDQPSDLYAAPETARVAMEHFVIDSRYVVRKSSDYEYDYLRNPRGLARIPEEQECCD